jgi:hypothetical protein
LTRDLLAMRDPFDGGPVVERVRRRAEIADGPFAERLPDLTLELRQPDGFSYAALSSRAGLERQALRRLTASEASGARGGSMPGAHRNHGMCILAGPDVRPGRYPLGALADAGATAMALCGCAPHPQAEGRPWRDCVDIGPLRAPGAESEVAAAPQRYDTDQESEVAERLRALGYLA